MPKLQTAGPLARLIGDQKAVTSIEYALIAALVAVVIVGALTSVGHHLGADFGSISSKL